MTHEDLVRAEGVPACYLVDPSGTWSIGSWTVHDCQLFWPGAAADELSRGGKNNRVPLLTGVHHVAVPTTDPLAGSDWYVRVFDFAAVLIEERETEVVAVLLQHPCGVRLLLRRTAAPLAALREYPLFGLTVASYTELQHWVEHLTTFDVEHSVVHQAHRGWAVTVTGPDLVRIQLQTDEGPSGEDE